MTGWTITCDSGGECPASINQDTGLAIFQANTGTKSIIYTITYTDENGNCGSTTIKQPGNCSGPDPEPPQPVGACDFIQEITTIPYTEYDGIVVKFSTDKCSLTIDNVRVNQKFVTISSVEGGNINVHVDANPNEQNTRPFKISLTASTTGEEEEEVTAEFNFTQAGKQSPSSDAEEWIRKLDCHDGSNGNPNYASHKAKTDSGSITIEIVNESNSDFLWCGKMKVYGTTNTTFYFREPSCFVCYEGQAYSHTWYCNKTNFIFMHSNDGHANGYDEEYKIYKTLSWKYPINRYAADKNNDGEWVSTDYVGGTNCNHLSDENISSRKLHIYEWYHDTKTNTWYKTGTPELGPVGGTLEKDPEFGTKAQSTITKIKKTINGTSKDYVIDDGNNDHSYVPEITIEAGAKYTFYVTKDNNYKFNSDEMHNSDNLNRAYLNHQNSDGNHTIIPLNVAGYKQ